MALGTTGGRTAAGRDAHPTAYSANVATGNQRTPLATLRAVFVVLTLHIGLLIAWLAGVEGWQPVYGFRSERTL
jgi:hypothetical protein